MRPPIIAVLGHVDHGKSTLLDFLRKSNVVAGEAGGITQHVAAYEVVHAAADGTKKTITFIDTPGHAAFKSMRERGVSIADIAILVVSAEDGVKAQTIEALEAIRESGIPMVVAINKIDKPAADINRTKASLIEKGVYLEGMGGDVPYAPISAKSGEGIPDLLDLLLLVAELEELTGDPSLPASGFVVEAHREAKRGVAATLIITNGSLQTGMAILAGGAIAPVRVMENAAGASIGSATFSTPISVFGFDGLPAVGAPFDTYENKKTAEKARTEAGITTPPILPNAQAVEGSFSLPVVLKADASGSLEALIGEVQNIGDEFTSIQVIQSGIGTISENDVKSAIAGSGTAPVILGFGVSTDANAIEVARQHDIEIETFDIIYKLTERLAELLQDRAPKRIVESMTGRARVLKQFSSRKDLQTIGGSVFEGFIEKKSNLRILRKGEVIGSGKIETIQMARIDASRVDAGNEFGAQIETSIELLPGDLLENVTTKSV
jgi:translation initiation factor IF-2